MTSTARLSIALLVLLALLLALAVSACSAATEPRCDPVVKGSPVVRYCGPRVYGEGPPP